MSIIPAKKKYAEKVVPEMKKQFGYTSNLAVPRIKKVVLNVGIGKIYKEADKIEEVVNFLKDVTGQKPVITKAKKAIAGFKTREGQEVGVSVTLRRSNMWDFIDRLVNITLPRTRDFQGIDPKSVDERGNLNIGIKEHMIFPEVVSERVKHVFGLQVTVTTAARSKAEGVELLRLLGFPLKNQA